MYDPEHEDYDDDEYKYYPDGGEFKKYEFKFDWTVWEKWLKDALDDIIQEGDNQWIVDGKKFPVSDSASQDTSKDQYFMYLGSNHYKEPIWKAKYFINDKLNTAYKNHIVSHAAHFLKQPLYYKGMFDNLN